MPAISTARQLTFTIAGNPPVQVTAIENNGKLEFTVDVQDTTKLTGDLRGFFFDMPDAKLAGMKVTSSDPMLTQSKVAKDAVLDLGNGASMAGKTATKFDVGMEWGTTSKSGADDISYAVKFTLSNTANNLTLDDIAGQRFGAKVDALGAIGTARTTTETILGTASAAPDAKDDVFTIKEDGAGQTSNAMTTASTAAVATKAVTLNVLGNDTDADRDVLTIIGLGDQPQHGTVSISADGKSLAYTPVKDYSGTDSFQYGVSDGKGGIDYAKVTVNITPVADAPVISFTTSAGDSVNQTIVHVTAKVTDLDGSESISAITAGQLAPGITLTALNAIHAVVGTPGAYTQDFVLNLPKDQTNHFDLGFTATAKEALNGVTASVDATTPIDYDYHSTTSAVQFTAYDQSMWSGGSAFRIDYDKFLGIDLGHIQEEIGIDVGVGSLYAGAEAGFKAGFDVQLHLNGGSVDATADYDVMVNSAYNHTTDQLQIDTAGVMTNLSLQTQSPEGSLYLAFVYDIVARIYAGFSVGFDVPLIGFVGAEDEYNLVGFDYHNTFVLADGDSHSAQTSVTLPEPFDVLSIDFAWPTITTQGSSATTSVTNVGESQNFLQANLDVDALVVKLVYAALGVDDGPNFLHYEDSVGPLSIDALIYDAVLSLGANFKQEFLAKLGDVNAVINFEDGSHRDFVLGQSMIFNNASAIDAGGNHDGHVDFTIDLHPQATLQNTTDIGFNLNYEQTIGQFGLGIDVSVGSIDIIDESFDIGPLYHRADRLDLGGINLYDSTFNLEFSHQKLAYFA